MIFTWELIIQLQAELFLVRVFIGLNHSRDWWCRWPAPLLLLTTTLERLDLSLLYLCQIHITRYGHHANNQFSASYYIVLALAHQVGGIRLRGVITSPSTFAI